MNTLIANVRHAARNHETVSIGGGEFGPAELLAAADTFDVMLAALQEIADMLTGHPDFNNGASKVHYCTYKARAAIVKATGESK